MLIASLGFIMLSLIHARGKHVRYVNTFALCYSKHTHITGAIYFILYAQVTLIKLVLLEIYLKLRLKTYTRTLVLKLVSSYQVKYNIVINTASDIKEHFLFVGLLK
jgi:hypothetical protein